ncbi:hypothetical protein YA0745_25475 [Pseudomonas synxantha]|uniref:Uncharacterized protein n=1 Tax=Pseudomonas synxantha TaxID=47883 RepID=A0ABS0ULA8_9PSED|nr:hypothetical protein [Pseudomonas synxantha]MBI6565375.1 hypothetical protein [Pseudomonas synxantha]MBI6581724.1 hypothetical protein [Pseudomonas synxantha]MBI6646278.1 hypothetical protein [Pseudomonas synxantha]
MMTLVWTSRWRCSRFVRWLLPIFLLWTSLITVATSGEEYSALPDNWTVAPGEKTKLATLPSKPDALKTTLGSLDVNVSESDPKSYDIVFTAPMDGEGKTAQVTFVVNGQSHALIVAIGPAGPWGAQYAPAFKVLFAMFVLAVVLEWGLAVLFNWRWFLEVFDAKGLRTLISVGFAFWVVAKYDLDLMTRLINILWGARHSSDTVSQFISALVLAGGSSGVNSMLVALGFRAVRTAELVRPKPPPTKAWISVTAVRSESVGPLMLLMSTDGGANYSLIQQFENTWESERRWWHFVLRDPGRWPRFGGFTLDPGTAYEFEVRGFAPDKVTPIVRKWGPHAIAAGAVLDIVLAV